ncbi:MAG: SDR family oxidoreductase [Acidobacteria bacterium]|nr:SDR family oxidoreductase [Acidobacteriota bacterium]
MMRVAISGATGYIGGRLVPALLDAGYAVRCLVRSPEKLKARSWSDRPGMEIVQTDLDDIESVVQALEGCAAAYYLVHSMTSAGSKYAEYDGRLARNFGVAAGRAKLGSILYLGGLGETGPNLSKHLTSRRQVEYELGAGGVPVTVFRAAMIIGSGSASFEILRYLVERLPVMITPRWVNTLSQPISVVNVIRYLVDALHVIETKGRTFDIGGPEALCYRDIMRIMAEELGLKRRWIIPVPILSPQLSSYWIHLITPLTHDIAKPLAEGLKNPVVCREDRIRDLIPQDLITVRGAIRTALAQVARNEVETSWSMAGAIPGDPDWAGGASFIDRRQAMVEAPAVAAFRAVCRIGGSHGWYAANALWTIRGWLDRLVGGPGLRRGRRDSELVAYGDAIDFWRVVGFELNRRLALRAEMRLPGDALLEFRVTPAENGRCTIEQVARFRPKGLLGMLYWYAVSPLHYIVFDGMLRGIRREANRIATSMAATKSLHQT